jgi:hypothetical protein
MAEYSNKPMKGPNKDSEKEDPSKYQEVDTKSILHYVIALVCTLFLFVFFLLCAAFRVLSMSQVYNWNLYIPAALLVIIPIIVILIDVIAVFVYGFCE